MIPAGSRQRSGCKAQDLRSFVVVDRPKSRKNGKATCSYCPSDWCEAEGMTRRTAMATPPSAAARFLLRLFLLIKQSPAFETAVQARGFIPSHSSFLHDDVHTTFLRRDPQLRLLLCPDRRAKVHATWSLENRARGQRPACAVRAWPRGAPSDGLLPTLAFQPSI